MSNPKAEKMCSGQALKLWDVWVYLKQCDWAFFVLADWSGVAALQNFWRTHFITLPLISFYCSQFFLILLSVLYALPTLSFHFFLFISTVDGVVTSHMALPSGTASLTHIPFKFQLYPWPLPFSDLPKAYNNLPSNKTIRSYAQRLSVLLWSVSFLKTCSSYLPFDTQHILWSVLIRHERPILETPHS